MENSALLSWQGCHRSTSGRCVLTNNLACSWCAHDPIFHGTIAATLFPPLTLRNPSSCWIASSSLLTKANPSLPCLLLVRPKWSTSQPTASLLPWPKQTRCNLFFLLRTKPQKSNVMINTPSFFLGQNKPKNKVMCFGFTTQFSKDSWIDAIHETRKHRPI